MIFKYSNFSFDLSKPIDISIPIKNGNNPKAFFAPDVSFQTVKTDDFVGSTQEGGILNFKNIFINPHGNGTHTECLGHITKNEFTINKCLNEYHFLAQLVSILPIQLENGDYVISEDQIRNIAIEKNITAIIIRTKPNIIDKKTRDWSNINHCYIHYKAMQIFVENGIKHFLIDTPSVDKKNDKGKLLAHKAFWGLLNAKTFESKAVEIPIEMDLPRKNCTISEMIFVNNAVYDDIYLLNISILSLEMDASPSKIILYKKNN